MSKKHYQCFNCELKCECDAENKMKACVQLTQSCGHQVKPDYVTEIKAD